MKKIALIILTMITIPTYATTMCAANDTVAVVLDSSMNIKGSSANANTWRLWSDSWTIYGTGTCLNSNHGKSMGGTVAHLHDTDNNGDDHLVTGSERYGRYCWCRLTHPVSSLWVFRGDKGSGCASDCAGFCLYSIQNNSFLVTLINSIAN